MGGDKQEDVSPLFYFHIFRYNENMPDKNKILKYSLVSLTLLISILSWYSASQAITVPGSSVWLLPVVLFSFLAIILYLDIILIKELSSVQVLVAFSLLIDYLFVLELGHLPAILIAILFAFWAISKIEKDLRLNVKLDLWKSIRTGSTMLIFALSLIIASQYYFQIKDSDKQNLIPQFNIGSWTGGLTSKILSAINPGFKNLDNEDLTVDEFILQIQKNQGPGSGMPGDLNGQINDEIEKSNPNMTFAQKQILKEQSIKNLNSAQNDLSQIQQQLVLREGRNKFSEIAGRNLTGNEKVSDVLSELINTKINQYLGSGLSDTSSSSPLPFILSVVLLLTIFPLGSFLNTFWILLVKLIFFILLKLGIVTVEKVQVEMEVIK